MKTKKQYNTKTILLDTYKKYMVLLLSCVLISTCFSGCSTSKTDNNKLQIISTIFPTYDFAKQICGNNAEVTILLPPELESHSYEPSPKDIIRIQNCDLFIYVGGESDSWIDKILNSMDTPIKTIKMMDCVNVLEEEIHDTSADQEDNLPEYDEHVWTSPKNSIKIANAIGNAVCKIDKKHIQTYKNNTTTYIKNLNTLDNDFTNFFATVKNKTIIFGDRFPFRYFTTAYGLNYYGAFPGCSTETEPSVSAITFLIDKIKSENISTVFYTEFSNHKIADSIAETTKTKTALLNSCHNVSKSDLASGVTYISLMKQNLATLKEAMK